MERLDPEDLSSALLAVPPNWIAGILSADPEWRERSAETVATNVIEILNPCALDAANQLALPLEC
jgi:hypothetical protein